MVLIECMAPRWYCKISFLAFFFGILELFTFTLCVWVFGVRVCLCTTCMHAVLVKGKGGLDPLELELQAGVRHHVGSGNRTSVFCEIRKCC